MHILVLSLSLLVVLVSCLFSMTSRLYEMVGLLIAQTVCLSVFNFACSGEHWLSYVLILVFLGGLMVIFAYMISLAPSEPMPGMKKSSMFIFFFIIIVDAVWFSFGKMFISATSGQIGVCLTSPGIVESMFYFFSVGGLIFVIVYLLVALLSVSFILLWAEGPLRGGL